MTVADIAERQGAPLAMQTSRAWVVSLRSAPMARDGWTTLASGRSGRSLSLLEVPVSARPVTARAGQATVVFDGELYDRADLDRRLAGSCPPPRTDAERVVRAYERWGEGMLAELKGIFAIVLWDDAREMLLGVRDRMGIYPFYYAVAGGELLLSVSQEALVCQPGVSHDLNRAHLTERLCGRWLAVEETYYAAVSRLPAAHVLRATEGGGRRQAVRYWDPAPLDQPMEWIRDDAVERFDAAFGDAVTRCLDGRPAGIFLSGGLDSVSIAAIAAEDSRTRGYPLPWGLSLAFPTPETNEEPVQRGVAATLGVPLVMVPFDVASGSGGHMAAALELSRTSEQPLLNFWLPAYMHLAAEGARRGCETILTGSGGDEWLGVSPYLAADLIHGGRFRELYELWSTQRKSFSTSSTAMIKTLTWKFGARPLLVSAAASALRRVAPWVLAADKRKYIRRTTPAWAAPDPALRREVDERAEQSIGHHEFGQFYLREMHRGLGHMLPSIESEEVFEAGNRIGQRRRAPFWDADLVETLFHVAPSELNRGGRSKGLVRQAMARRFPQLGFEAQKKVVSQNYFGSIVAEQWEQSWQRLGGVPALGRLGVVDEKLLRADTSSVLERRERRRYFNLWDVLNLEVWARERC